jgi:hypothetical protein
VKNSATLGVTMSASAPARERWRSVPAEATAIASTKSAADAAPKRAMTSKLCSFRSWERCHPLPRCARFMSLRASSSDGTETRSGANQ